MTVVDLIQQSREEELAPPILSEADLKTWGTKLSNRVLTLLRHTMSGRQKAVLSQH